MAMAIHLLLPLLLLASLRAAGPLPAAAAAASHQATSATNTHAHLHHHGHGHHHHRSPSTMTDTSPQHPCTPVASEAAFGAEAAASTGAAAAADPGLRASPEIPSPPPSFSEAADLVSGAPQAEGAGWSSAERVVLQKVARVLSSLGYNEMASAAASLADSPVVTTWQGAITIFAAPDLFFLQATCPECSRRQLLLRHLALGYFPYNELAAARSINVFTASESCINIDSKRDPFDGHHVGVYIDEIKVSRPSLYDDGRYIVHGLDGFVPLLSSGSCIKGAHRHRRRRQLSSGSASASAVRTAMELLRDRGFGFVALVMRVKDAELEKLPNLTVFAVDDNGIFTGGHHGYVSAVRYHIVPGHRLTRNDLVLLRPGTTLPTLSGEFHKLVITHGAGSDTGVVHINYVPVRTAAVLTTSRLAVHGIDTPFPRLSPASSVAVASAIPMSGTCAVEAISDCLSAPMTYGAPPVDKTCSRASATTPVPPHPCSRASAAMPHHPVHGGSLRVTEKVGRAGVGARSDGGGHGAAAAAGAVGVTGVVAIALRCLMKDRKWKQHKQRQRKMVRRQVEKLQQRKLDPHLCRDCQMNDIVWTASCCGFSFCSLCVVNGYLDSHLHVYRRRGGDFCGRDGQLVPVVEPEFDPVHGEYFFTGEERNDGDYMKMRTFVSLEQLQARRLPKRLLVWLKRSDNSRLAAVVRSPVKKNSNCY